MATVFFKKSIKNVAVIVSFFIISVSLIFAYLLKNATCVAHSQTFYFLVSVSTHVEAGAYEVAQKGGAGYLLCTDERAYVAFSVYFTETESKSAQKNLRQDECKIVTKTAGNLYFKSYKEKQNASRIVDAFSCLRSCMDLLNKESVRLANGATQESSGRILKSLQKQFSYLGKKYETCFSDFSTMCKNAANALNTVMESTIYVKDLRKTLCSLCDEYVRLAGKFSL